MALLTIAPLAAMAPTAAAQDEALHPFVPVATLEQPYVTKLAPHEGGVAFLSVKEGSWYGNSRILVANASGDVRAAHLGEFGLALASDLQGGLYARDRLWGNLRQMRADGNAAAGPGETEPIGFGPDGRLYACDRSRLIAIAEDRSVTPIAPECSPRGVFAPDGTLYFARWGYVARVVVATGEVQRLNVTRVPLAFDAAGAAYGFQHAQDEATLLVRFDPLTGEVLARVAQVPGVGTALAFSGGRLHVATSVKDPSDSRPRAQLGLVATDAAGFEGFGASWTLPPAPDLLVHAFAIKQAHAGYPLRPLVIDQRELVVTIANRGGAASPATTVMVTRLDSPVVPPPGSTRTWAAPVPALAPGETFTVSFQWDATLEAGEREFVAHVDPADKVIEMDERNNARVVSTVARATLP